MSVWRDGEGRLHVGVMVDGRRLHRRLPEGATKSDAKLVEADLRKAAGSAPQKRPVPIPGDPPLDAIMALYLEHCATLRSPATARFHALRAGPWCDGRKASEVRQVAAKMAADMHGHYAPATINRSLGAIKKALRLAFDRGILATDLSDHLRRLPENNARHTYLSIEEVRALADAASASVRAAIWIALLTGCRRGEILAITPASIEGNRLRIRAGSTKTLRERTVPIIPALRPWLEHLPLALNFEGLKSGFARARAKIGRPDIHYHDLRHSCASLLINLGEPLEVIRDILGHTTVKTTERYAHLMVDRQREALERLSALV